MNLCDSHIHVGQFYEAYTSPEKLSEMMRRLGVDRYAVSSTTTCEHNHDKIIGEIRRLLDIEGDRVVPILWLSNYIISDDAVLQKYLKSGIGWKCLKVHPDLEPYAWDEDTEDNRRLLILAGEMNLPILIHTGGEEYSQAGRWGHMIANNPNHTFILAHCRPFDQAARILLKYPNVYGDLSFVDSADFESVHKLKLYKKLMWGSDLPIAGRFTCDSIENYYSKRLVELRKKLTDNEFRFIASKNFNSLFN